MASMVMLGGGMIPAMALVKLLAARMRADGVSVGIVRYLCLKKYCAANLCMTCVTDEYFVAAIMLP